MRWWLSWFFHRLGYWLYDDDSPELPELPIQYVIELPHGPRERSEPLDAHALWREQVYDGSYYIEEQDVYHPGTYL